MSAEKFGPHYFDLHRMESLEQLVESGEIDTLNPVPVGSYRRADVLEGRGLWERYVNDPKRKPRSKRFLADYLGFTDPDNPQSLKEISQANELSYQTVRRIVGIELAFVRGMVGVPAVDLLRADIPPGPTYEEWEDLLRENLGELGNLNFTALRRKVMHEIDAVATLPWQRNLLEQRGITTLDALMQGRHVKEVFGKSAAEKREEMEEIKKQVGNEPLIVGKIIKSNNGWPPYEYASSDGYIINQKLKHNHFNELRFLDITGPSEGLLKQAGFYHIKDTVVALLERRDNIFFALNTGRRQSLLRALVKFFRINPQGGNTPDNSTI